MIRHTTLALAALTLGVGCDQSASTGSGTSASGGEIPGNIVTAVLSVPGMD